MRLQPAEVHTIVREVKQALGAETQVWLYGSRLNDAARGGDVDLLIEVAQSPSGEAVGLLRERLEALLMLPVDVQVRVAGEPGTSFQQLVAHQAVPLELAS